MDALIGQTLGRYRVDRLLGSGGMGAVYAGVQVDLGRPVAIKVLRPELSMDPSIAQRFKREAEVAASLSHPHIAQVTDFGIEDGRPYLVMDLLEGESLGALLDREGALDEARVRRIAIQILAGLASAHERGVVHRDLKPENVFVQHTSGMDLVKLLDFGIARLTDADAQMTKTGSVLGTPAYMSPEQARGRAVDARSDVFSVGAVLYEALAGRRAFTGANHHELLFAVVEQTPPSLAEVAAGTSPGLIAVVERALSKDAHARFASATEMKAALEATGTASGTAASGERQRTLVGVGEASGRGAAEAGEASGPDVALAPTIASSPGLDSQPRQRGGLVTEALPDERGPEDRGGRQAAPTPVVAGQRSSTGRTNTGPTNTGRTNTGRSSILPWAVAAVAVAAAGAVAWVGLSDGGDAGSATTAAAGPSAVAVGPEDEEAVSGDAGSARPAAALPRPLPRAGGEPDDTVAALPEPVPHVEREHEGAVAGPRRAGRPRVVTRECGGHDREMHLLTARERLGVTSLFSREGFRYAASGPIRETARGIEARMTECFRGHYVDTSVELDLSVAEDGTVTGVRTRQYCPLDPEAARCAERVAASAFSRVEGEGAGVLRVAFGRLRGS